MSSSLEVDASHEEVPLVSTPDPAAMRVDQLVERLFPAPTLGQLFFARFCDRAAQEHTVLPDEPADAIAILTRSIVTLGKELGIGHDTAQKYVVIYRALGLMKKRKIMGQLAFVMRTGIYHPPETLEANLNALLAHYKRDKLRGIVELVKERCLLYSLISQDLLASLQQLQTLLHPGPAESRRALEQRLVQSQHLMVQIIRTLHRTRLPRSPSSVDALWNLPPAAHADEEESTQDEVQGRREREHAATNLPRLAHQVDSTQLQPIQESTQIATPGRFEQAPPAARLPETPRRVDSAGVHPPKRPVESTQVSHEGRFDTEHGSPNLPADTPQVDSGTPPNVNVILRNVIDSLNVNVSPVAEYLRWIFSEPPAKRGYYHNLYNKLQLQNTEAWLAATIETLIGLHQVGTVRLPGKYFYDRCVLLHRTGIPPDTAALVQRYGSLTYPQLLEVLQQSGLARSRSPSPQPPVPGQVAHGSPIQRRLPRDKVHPGMSREDLRQVIELMRSNNVTCTWITQPYKQANGSCALLVDDGIGHQRWVYSLQDWRTCLARMRTPNDLFSP